jgi:hypothetical protein
MKKILSSLLLFAFIFGLVNFSQENFTHAKVTGEGGGSTAPNSGDTTDNSDTNEDDGDSEQKKIKDAISARLTAVYSAVNNNEELNDFIFYQAMNELFFNYGIRIEEFDWRGDTPLFRIYSLQGKNKFSLAEISQKNKESYLFDKGNQLEKIKAEKKKKYLGSLQGEYIPKMYKNTAEGKFSNEKGLDAYDAFNFLCKSKTLSLKGFDKLKLNKISNFRHLCNLKKIFAGNFSDNYSYEQSKEKGLIMDMQSVKEYNFPGNLIFELSYISQDSFDSKFKSQKIMEKMLSDKQQELAKKVANASLITNIEKFKLGNEEAEIVKEELDSTYASQRAAGVARSQSSFDVNRYLSVGSDRQELIDTYSCQKNGKDETRVFYYTGDGDDLVVSRVIISGKNSKEAPSEKTLEKTRKSKACFLQKVELSIGQKGWTISSFVQAIVNILIRIVGSVGVIAVVWSGIMLITANGDDAQIQNAKDVVLYAVIGVVVAYMANLLVGLLWSSL